MYPLGTSVRNGDERQVKGNKNIYDIYYKLAMPLQDLEQPMGAFPFGF